jgi:hypothetical protein
VTGEQENLHHRPDYEHPHGGGRLDPGSHWNRLNSIHKRILGRMTPVSDGGLPRCSVEANLTLPSRTALSSVGTQPDKGSPDRRCAEGTLSALSYTPSDTRVMPPKTHPISGAQGENQKTLEI